MSAGWCLLAAGALFLAVVIYLYAVLLPSGLTFAMFDDSDALLTWAAAHSSRYTALYVIYLLQQLALLPVPALLWLAPPSRPHGGPLLRTAAAAAGLVSIPLAVLSIGQLVMVAHLSGQLSGVSDPAMRQTVILAHDLGADLAKGARVLSEFFLGLWLLWLGQWLRTTTERRGWWLVSTIGGWTSVVGIWKLLDPAVAYEDWLAFLTGAAQLAAGIGLVLSARRMLLPDASARDPRH